jgi:glutamine amidotransferase
MLAIIDYQAGNQTSVKRALAFLGLEAEITADPDRLRRASGVIFPGVGAAGQAMGLLKKTGLDQVIKRLPGEGRPFLGICLGCQIMLERSEENDAATLGLIAGDNARFDAGLLDESGRRIRVPHMGWNNMRQTVSSPLFDGLDDGAQFYFVHSYYPRPEKKYVLGLTDHGLTFASAFGRDGLWALQFHPEKSGPPGLRILKNFHDYCRRER